MLWKVAKKTVDSAIAIQQLILCYVVQKLKFGVQLSKD